MILYLHAAAPVFLRRHAYAIFFSHQGAIIVTFHVSFNQQNEVIPVHSSIFAQKISFSAPAAPNELFTDEFYQPYHAAVETTLRMLCHARRILCADMGQETVRQITFRLKTPNSISDKLRKKRLPVTCDAANAALNDVAGLRVVLTSVEAVYRYAALLTSSPLAEYVLSRDYIATPKKSGYQSLHLLMMVPVVCHGQHLMTPVEIQLRTTAMDAWAVMEHDVCYKPASAKLS